MFVYRYSDSPYHFGRFNAHDKAEVTGLCRHPFSDKLASVGDDKTVRFWTPEGRYSSQVKLAVGRTRTLFTPGPVAWSNTGDLLAVGCGPHVYVVSSRERWVVQVLETGHLIEALDWSDGRTLTVAAVDGCVVRFADGLKVSTRRPIRKTADGVWLGCRTRKLEFPDGRPRSSGACVSGTIVGLGFAFMGESLVVRDDSTKLAAPVGHLDLPGEFGAIALEPSTRTLVFAAGPGSRYVNHLRIEPTGPHLWARNEQPHDEPVTAAACRHGYTYHATGDSGGRVVVWTAGRFFENPTVLKVLDGHAGAVRAMTFLSHDGTNNIRLATAGDDGTIRRWDVPLPKSVDLSIRPERVIDL